MREAGPSAQWRLRNSAYAPRCFAAAAADRFALVAQDHSSGKLNLLVVAPTGLASATPIDGGIVPAALRGVTLRDDGRLYVQTSAQGVLAFQPAP
jgi:hypothetical protein